MLKRGALLFCAAALLASAWAPVAILVNGGFDDDRRRAASLPDPGRGGASVLPAAGLDAPAFLGPPLVPAVEPERIDLAAPTPAPGDPPAPSGQPLSERPFARLVERAADRHGVDPRLVHALIEVESGYRPDAVSASGAMGLMQLMPGTARRFGVADPLDPEANIEAGTRYLRVLLDEFGPLFRLGSLAAYHAGEPAVRRHGGVPPWPVTRKFVRRVLDVLLSQPVGAPAADR